MINVSFQSEMQNHLLHNISDATREVKNLTEREVTLTLGCFLARAVVHLIAAFLFHYSQTYLKVIQCQQMLKMAAVLLYKHI